MQALIPIIIILTYASMLAITLKKRIEQTIPISVVEIVLIIYLTGMLDNLKLGVQIIELMAIFQIAILLYLLIKEKETIKIKENLERILTPGLVIYVILYIILMFINNNRIFGEHDEFTHWAVIIKNMFLYNTYGTNAQSIVEFNEYPPFTAIFQYLFLAVNKVYSEDIIITAQGMLYFSIIIPIMKNIKWDKSLKNALIIVPVIIAIPMIFFKNFYLEILVDGMLGIMFATTIFYGFEDEETKFKYLKIFTGLTMLCLTKTTGIALAILAVIIISIRLLKNKKSSKHEIRLLTLICVIVTILTMMWYMKVSGTKKRWDFSQYINNESTTENAEIGRKFLKTTFLEQCITDKKLTAFSMTLILICTNMYIIKNNNKKDNSNLKYYSIAMLISIPIYLLMQFITYISIFDEIEAKNLDCFDRYSSTIFLAISVFQILVLNEEKESKFNFKKMIITLTIIICMLPQENIMTKYINAKSYIATEKNNRDFYTKIKEYKNLLNSNDNVLFINSSKDDFKKVKLINQYEIMPAKIEISDRALDSNEELQRVIKNRKCTYVYVYRIKDEEKNRIKETFESEYIANDTLYKVVDNNEGIFLELERE